MKPTYFDIMIGDSFFNQVAYPYPMIFERDYEDLMNYVLDKFPSLLKEKKSIHIIKGNKVFNR